MIPYFAACPIVDIKAAASYSTFYAAILGGMLTLIGTSTNLWWMVLFGQNLQGLNFRSHATCIVLVLWGSVQLYCTIFASRQRQQPLCFPIDQKEKYLQRLLPA